MQNERYADPLDEAQALTASLVEGAVAQARAANAPQRHPDFDGKHCLDCEIDIPVERLQAGRIRCVHCQEALDKQTARRVTPAPFSFD